MKFIAFILSIAATNGFALTLRVSVPTKDPLNPYKSIESLTYCNLSSQNAKITPLDPMPSRRWQISIQDLKFADGSHLTKEEILSSLAQSSPLTRTLLTKIQLKKQVLTLNLKIPLSDPTLFLGWPIIGTKPSRFCGNWNIESGDLNHLKLDNGINQILVKFGDQKNALEELSKGIIDVLIPETWTEIDGYLRKNPHISALITTKPPQYYFHLNPNRSISRQTRRDILANLKHLDIAFPLTKKDGHNLSQSLQMSSQKSLGTTNTNTKLPALVASSLAFPDPIRLLKSILINLKTDQESSTIRVSDELTLEYEIKTNKLDGWLLSEDMPWINYHSKIVGDLYGKSAWSSPELDKLIEDALKDKNDAALNKILIYLENEGLMMEVAEQRMIALVGKSIRAKKINESSQGGRFLEKLLEQETPLGK